MNLSSLNIRDSPIESRKSQISIANNNTILFNDDFSPPYPFPPSPYSFPSSSYLFIIYKERIFHFSMYFNNSWELAIASIDIHSYFRSLVFSFVIDSFRNMSCSSFHSVKRSFHSALNSAFRCRATRWSYNQQTSK